MARNLIDDFSGFLRGKRILIHDRDPLYTKAFREFLGYAHIHGYRDLVSEPV